jgi:hypothetical protein
MDIGASTLSRAAVAALAASSRIRPYISPTRSTVPARAGTTLPPRSPGDRPAEPSATPIDRRRQSHPAGHLRSVVRHSECRSVFITPRRRIATRVPPEQPLAPRPRAYGPVRDVTHLAHKPGATHQAASGERSHADRPTTGVTPTGHQPPAHHSKCWLTFIARRGRLVTHSRRNAHLAGWP